MPDGKMTNHDMLQQVYHAIYDDDGLTREVAAIKIAIVGSMNGKQKGILNRLEDNENRLEAHEQQHKEERTRIIAIFTAFASGVGVLVSWVIDYFFHR